MKLFLSPAAPGHAPVLHLRPPAQAVGYETVACWETYTNGDYRTSTITKQVLLRGYRVADGSCEIDIATISPMLTKPEELESLEILALRLATLYEQLRVRVAPTGRLIGLLNHDALLHAWAQLTQRLQDSTTAEDQITPTVIKFVNQQLQDPARVVHSLRHDYLYRALIPELYAQPLTSLGSTGPPREFSQFFDKLPLWFSERIVVQPPVDGATLTLEFYGTLNAQKTDVAAIGQLMAAAVGPAATTAGEPHFYYQACYHLDAHTGLPQRANLTVYGRLGTLYNKQYTLTLSRL